MEAIPANDLRAMVSAAIRQHIPADRWARLQQIEGEEKAEWAKVMAKMKGVA